MRDVTSLAGTGTFGLITAFDAIHDRSHSLGTELALQMLADATFGQVRVERLPEDLINSYDVATR